MGGPCDTQALEEWRISAAERRTSSRRTHSESAATAEDNGAKQTVSRSNRVWAVYLFQCTYCMKGCFPQLLQTATIIRQLNHSFDYSYCLQQWMRILCQ